MSLHLTELVSDNFQRPNESPLGAPWVLDSHGDPGLQVVGDVCEPIGVFNNYGELYNFSLPNDQYASFTLAAALGNVSSSIRVFVRATDDGSAFPSLPAYQLIIHQNGSWVVVNTTMGGSGLTLNVGDTFVLAAVGSSIFFLQNGTLIAQGTDSQFTSGGAALMVTSISSPSQIQISSFAVGAASTADFYSVPDCRKFGNFPNLPVDVQGTQTYTTPSVDSRAAGAPVDSRAAGAPVDSRTSANIPTNSRQPGVYGPGEN